MLAAALSISISLTGLVRMYGKTAMQLVHVQTCFIVMAGLQSLSSSRIDRHTVPDG